MGSGDVMLKHRFTTIHISVAISYLSFRRSKEKYDRQEQLHLLALGKAIAVVVRVLSPGFCCFRLWTFPHPHPRPPPPSSSLLPPAAVPPAAYNPPPARTTALLGMACEGWVKRLLLRAPRYRGPPLQPTLNNNEIPCALLPDY